ncbi:hypothetical protein BpHYR1_010595 [Brachionus plicatilis]|uniref:Uncharacterized protein n=1 Tax=Brachionus plicatilis TaxID=10195 RepID=A0A3M7PRG6_BRAPC|nr:hypothetical protein BpHYR1_010595 [Brachionus plicatilis]
MFYHPYYYSFVASERRRALALYNYLLIQFNDALFVHTFALIKRSLAEFQSLKVVGNLTYFYIVDNKFLKAIWANMSCLCGRSVTNLWHQVHSLEASSDSVINTLRFSPVRLFKLLHVTLIKKDTHSYTCLQIFNNAYVLLKKKMQINLK